ncbi:hypothetical protein OF364_00040 [Mycoplasma enhydrae]|uniref:hypothetical protein n=1 Tax=Mycoplasma enhydrae TaxID=2499220 RepID=UPI0021E6E5BD|nr:hypothetical protein [Mycoplasma enhydrae]MCV3753218.1 hypothetical protein [Mycoplasma enhydrae]
MDKNNNEKAYTNTSFAKIKAERITFIESNWFETNQWLADKLNVSTKTITRTRNKIKAAYAKGENYVNVSHGNNGSLNSQKYTDEFFVSLDRQFQEYKKNNEGNPNYLPFKEWVKEVFGDQAPAISTIYSRRLKLKTQIANEQSYKLNLRAIEENTKEINLSNIDFKK